MTKDVLLWVCNVMPFGDATAQEVDDLQSEMERREKWDRDFTKKATDTRLALRKRKKTFLSEDDVNPLLELLLDLGEAEHDIHRDEGRRAFLDQMLTVAARIPDTAQRDQFADRLAHRARLRPGEDKHGDQLLSEDEVNALTDLAEQKAEDGRG